jgi:hypothetical protein
VVKSGRYVGLTTLPPSCSDCLEICEPQPPGTLWPVQACNEILLPFTKTCAVFSVLSLNPLKPNDTYIGLTAPLTSKRCILYIYSTNINTEHFKHGTNSTFFSSSKYNLFHNSNVFGSCNIHILYTGCAKIKKKNNSGTKRLTHSQYTVFKPSNCQNRRPSYFCLSHFNRLWSIPIRSPVSALQPYCTNSKEYQEYLLGGKGGRCAGLALPLSCAVCLEIWEPQPPGFLRALSSSVMRLLYPLTISYSFLLTHSQYPFHNLLAPELFFKI